MTPSTLCQTRLNEANLPGLSIAVTDRRQLLRVSTYGFADIAAQIPVRPDTRFEVGSLGKGFTSISLLQLRESRRAFGVNARLRHPTRRSHRAVRRFTGLPAPAQGTAVDLSYGVGMPSSILVVPILLGLIKRETTLGDKTPIIVKHRRIDTGCLD
ncbi:MAG: beta-lactamase family protein [Blastochloris sp.]|nr:beta-lactamase family protein [Blastochloris sp.]